MAVSLYSFIKNALQSFSKSAWEHLSLNIFAGYSVLLNANLILWQGKNPPSPLFLNPSIDSQVVNP